MLRPRCRWGAAWALVALLLVSGALYALLAPASVNGDGVGYLKRLEAPSLAPGHPAYVALGRLWVGQHRGLAAAKRLRWLSLLSTLLALGLFAASCRELDPEGRWLLATALLAASFAVTRAATQVEVYAPALAACVAALYGLLRARRSPPFLLLAAGAVALATLLHLTLGLLVVPLALLGWRWRGLRWAAGSTAMALTLVVGGLLVTAVAAGHQSPAAALRWYLGADHGLPYPLRPWTPAVALWGLARSVVAAPYLHEAGALWAGALGAGSLLSFGALLWLRRRPRPSGAALLLWSWCAPLTLFGLLFYPSDTERWIFVLPALALFASGIRWRGAWALPVALAVVTLVHLAPRALDTTAAERARAVERLLQPDDLLIAPGHGWSEQIGLGMRRPPRRLLLVPLLAGAPDHTRTLRRLRAQIRRHLGAGRRVFVTRLGDDADPRGFKELARWGLDRRRYRALFADLDPRPMSSAGGVWRLAQR